MYLPTRSPLALLPWFLSCAFRSWAGFEPIELATKSYNEDIVVERSAPPPVVSVTTASMEQGTANLGFTWFERGYYSDWPATGLPRAGSILTSDLLADHQYQLPFSYQRSNAVLIDAVRTNADLTFEVPTNYVALSFLTSSGSGRNQIAYSIQFQDGTSEAGKFTSRNWYNDGEPAWAANGCVNVKSFVRSGLNSYNPRLYSEDIALLNSFSPVVGVELSLVSGSGHTAIFAVSGATSVGGSFAPIMINGYNEDLVVEATSVQPGFLTTNTTATMDSGTANARFTWYEQGYCPVAPSSGLPMAGTLFSSESDPAYRFHMPYSYFGPDAIVLDSSHSNAVMTLVTPAKYLTLSFLTAASGGAAVSECAIRHSNGQFETNSFTAPDWLGNSAPAITTHGRVSVSTKQMDYLESEGPRLFASDVALSDQESPVTHVVLSFGGTRPDSRVVIFAVSGLATGTPWPTRPVLSISRTSDGRLLIQSSQPGKLESCESWSNSSKGWREEGPISSSVTLTSAPVSGACFYRVLAQ